MAKSPDRPYSYLTTESDFRRKKKSEYGTLGLTGTGAVLSVSGMAWAVNEISKGNLTMESPIDMIGTGMIVTLTMINIALAYIPISTLRGIHQEMWLRSLINSGQIIEAPHSKTASPQLGEGSTRPTFLQKALSAPVKRKGII